ncbi:MAB_1171c family putative transporter [Streptomyces sp. 769]|uniref:MAB_1171c family putative transporter n=1 Tax=Streptomyces sp. 769 TaxID=1262452 RepID=UPI00058054B6|nr:MAB_1171c family putative transporter [Streptomyces sp. 769]
MAVVLVFAVLATAVAWRLFQLLKDPRNPSQRSVSLCLACALASYLVASPVGPAFDTVADPGWGKLLQNVLLLAAAYFVMCVYLYAASDERTGRRRARLEGLALALIVGVITVAALAAPRSALTGSVRTADMTVVQVAVFYLVAGLYLLYALAAASYWTRRYARMSQRPVSTGLWVAAVGLLGGAVVCAVNAVFVIVRWQGGAIPKALTVGVALVLMASLTLVAVGFTYPGVRARLAAVRVWREHRRIHRQLKPLWRLLCQAYPHSVLTPPGGTWRDRRRANGVHRRYHRRVVECRDGLVQISTRLQGRGHEGTIVDLARPEVLAQHLRAAVDALANGAPVSDRAVPLAVPENGDRDTDVQQLVALSQALRSGARSGREARC